MVCNFINSRSCACSARWLDHLRWASPTSLCWNGKSIVGCSSLARDLGWIWCYSFSYIVCKKQEEERNVVKSEERNCHVWTVLNQRTWKRTGEVKMNLSFFSSTAEDDEEHARCGSNNCSIEVDDEEIYYGILLTSTHKVRSLPLSAAYHAESHRRSSHWKCRLWSLEIEIKSRNLSLKFYLLFYFFMCVAAHGTSWEHTKIFVLITVLWLCYSPNGCGSSTHRSYCAVPFMSWTFCGWNKNYCF